jgi:hypothetical protein
MKRSSAAMIAMLILSGWMIGGCNSAGNAVRNTPTREAGKFADATARFAERERYVDYHTSRLAQSGRFANEEEARIYAGYEWDTHERNRQDKQTQTTTWSSRDEAKRQQKQLEASLEKLAQD